MFEKAVPAIAVRELRQWLRGAGWGESQEGWIGGYWAWIWKRVVVRKRGRLKDLI